MAANQMMRSTPRGKRPSLICKNGAHHEID
jgi:hypothetical protein